MTDIYDVQGEFRRIEAVLDERRSNAKRALEIRRARAYDMAPDLERIEYDIAAAGIKYNRALLAGTVSLTEAQSGIEADINALAIERDALLSGNSLPAGYLALEHACEKCGDTGYLPGEGGTPVRCECFKQLLFNGMESGSNIISAGSANFRLFDENLFSEIPDEARYRRADSPRENICKIRDSAKRFIRAFNKGSYENLYFYGQPGSGKTFMAASIAHELMRGGTAVLYLSASQLFNIITEYRMRSFRDDGYRDTRYHRILSCKLLIIDDLCTEPKTDSRYSEFITLLNERVAPRACSTIIISNKELEKLQDDYDERILSRMVGSFRIIKFFGDDIRLSRPGGLVPGDSRQSRSDGVSADDIRLKRPVGRRV